VSDMKSVSAKMSRKLNNLIIVISRTYTLYGRAYMLQCCDSRLSSVTLRIVAKRCVLEQKLLLTAYRKS